MEGYLGSAKYFVWLKCPTVFKIDSDKLSKLIFVRKTNTG